MGKTEVKTLEKYFFWRRKYICLFYFLQFFKPNFQPKKKYYNLQWTNAMDDNPISGEKSLKNFQIGFSSANIAIWYLPFLNGAVQLIVNANLTVCILTENVHFFSQLLHFFIEFVDWAFV